ncbi:HAD family hydrolase [Demequina sp. NBRC 110057]|uniref:HAD family hydrolase n=1 Tax=Demequina sp. NBRC 110057 TaxID=1570346 RepID=UPI000A0781C8|nr:HAD family hydrolase [Demequina sp. NBRC 110057]
MSRGSGADAVAGPGDRPAIRGILLDVDDTLVDTRGAFRHALLRVADEYLDAGADAEAVLAHWRDDRGGWYRAHTRGEMSHREQRKRRAQDLHATFGGPDLDDDAYDVWDAGFERHFREGWKPFPDAAPLLDALDAAGIPYGSVSNANLAYQELKLAACGLERVEMFVGVDTFGVGKPDPRVFLEGCARLSLPADAVAYVGDEPDLDAAGAARAGLTGVWLDRPGTRRTGHDGDDLGDLGDRTVRASGLDDVMAALGL